MSEKTMHDNDCSIYSARHNGGPECGICICGYGLQQSRKGYWKEMYSRELLEELMKKGHPKLYEKICERERKKNSKITEGEIMKLFERELEKKCDEGIENLFGGKIR